MVAKGRNVKRTGMGETEFKHIWSIRRLDEGISMQLRRVVRVPGSPELGFSKIHLVTFVLAVITPISHRFLSNKNHSNTRIIFEVFIE